MSRDSKRSLADYLFRKAAHRYHFLFLAIALLTLPFAALWHARGGWSIAVATALPAILSQSLT